MAIETRLMASPIKIGRGEKLISIKFPPTASSIGSIDTTDLKTIDVSECSYEIAKSTKEQYETTTCNV